MPAPATTDKPWWSYDVGLVHLVGMSTEHDYLAGGVQWTWLENDLKTVDRTKTPWLLVIIHAPWYNSNSAHQCVLMRLRCSAGRRSRPRVPPPAHPLPCPPGATASSCA